MAGKAACTLLHLGPGLANGLANLHNARRARTPIVNVVGEHATYHRKLDAPLTSDITGFASPVSGWIHVSESASTVAEDAARAIQAAMQPPGQIATLILPSDTAWNPASGAAPSLKASARSAPDASNIESSIQALQSGEPCALLMNGLGVSDAGLRLASRIAQKTGARLIGDTFIARIPRGAGRVEVTRLPYFSEQAEEMLAGLRHLILVDTKAPVSFFAYPGRASELTPQDCQVHPLALTRVALDLVPDPALPGVRIEASVRTSGQTGVEMEALTAVSVACLTIYDMIKAVEKSMRIEGIRLVLKDGGKSGRYEAEA